MCKNTNSHWACTIKLKNLHISLHHWKRWSKAQKQKTGKILTADIIATEKAMCKKNPNSYCAYAKIKLNKVDRTWQHLSLSTVAQHKQQKNWGPEISFNAETIAKENVMCKNLQD
jgi:hypothetical protein